MYRILRFQEEEEKTWMYSNSKELKSLEKKTQGVFELAGV